MAVLSFIICFYGLAPALQIIAILLDVRHGDSKLLIVSQNMLVDRSELVVVEGQLGEMLVQAVVVFDQLLVLFLVSLVVAG
jgi:hypothetical protein